MVTTYYWFDVWSLAGMPFMSGAAPPPSRKLTATPELPPRLDESSAPAKYGSRLTLVPLISPGARIPGTVTPVLILLTGKTTYLSQCVD